MRRFPILTLIAAAVVLGTAQLALACSALSSSVSIETFECFCEDDPQQPNQLPIFVVSGTIKMTHRKSDPTLGNIVVELEKKVNNVYTPIARQVLNQNDDPMVHTCLGSFTQAPMTGRLVLTDQQGHELTFDQVKDLPEGQAMLQYIATFAGVTNLELGERVRIKVYTTAFDVHAAKTCTVDASGDGIDDIDVKTLKFQRTVRVPAIATLITPPPGP
jgi:hypothetical protein